MEAPGFEPGAFRMQSERDTTTPRPQFNCTSNNFAYTSSGLLCYSIDGVKGDILLHSSNNRSLTDWTLVLILKPSVNAFLVKFVATLELFIFLSRTKVVHADGTAVGLGLASIPCFSFNAFNLGLGEPLADFSSLVAHLDKLFIGHVVYVRAVGVMHHIFLAFLQSSL